MRLFRPAASLLALTTPLLALPCLAQTDSNPTRPNVMLLVDNSGSMEYKSSANEFPTCNPGGGENEQSRWIELVEVLTGSTQDYRCQSVDRHSAAFLNEYALDGVAPYDYQYPNPYHRPVSGSCTPGPGSLATNAYEYPSDAIRFHDYGDTNSTCTNFSQANDGLLDAFASGARFGLMTFDTLTSSGTGVSGYGE